VSTTSDERRERLDEIAATYDPSDPNEQFDYWLKRLQLERILAWRAGSRMLELGCATGELTSLLAPHVGDLHVVEGSESNVAVARKRVPDATFVHSLWEEFRPDDRFSDVVACNAVEHVEHPVPLLAHVATWLERGGRVHIVVPNGLSLHRLVGVELGLQTDPLALTSGDTAQGHVRNYTIDTLLADVAAAGLRVLHWEPVFVKLLPNREMLSWSWDLIRAMDRVARRVPEHGAELYVVAEAP